MGLLQAIEIERGIVAHISFNDLCSEEVAIVSGMVAEQHLQFCTFLQDDEHATVDHQGDLSPRLP